MGRKKIKHQYLFIAVKPIYAAQIVSKHKDIELRKQKPHIGKGDYVIIYASSPLKSVLGIGIVKRIIDCSPNDMWTHFYGRLGITEQDFNSYYANHNRAIGIEFEFVKAINPISLAELKMVDPNFHPPQIYRYVTNTDIKALFLFKKQKV